MCTATQVLGVAEKRRAALKRKLAALQASANEKLADAERKVAKINQQASKLPNLGGWHGQKSLFFRMSSAYGSELVFYGSNMRCTGVLHWASAYAVTAWHVLEEMLKQVVKQLPSWLHCGQQAVGQGAVSCATSSFKWRFTSCAWEMWLNLSQVCLHKLMKLPPSLCCCLLLQATC
jgi:hypothetical protein